MNPMKQRTVGTETDESLYSAEEWNTPATTPEAGAEKPMPRKLRFSQNKPTQKGTRKIKEGTSKDLKKRNFPSLPQPEVS